MSSKLNVNVFLTEELNCVQESTNRGSLCCSCDAQKRCCRPLVSGTRDLVSIPARDLVSRATPTSKESGSGCYGQHPVPGECNYCRVIARKEC